MSQSPDFIPGMETALRYIERDENDPDYDLIESHKAIRVVVVELARRLRLSESATPDTAAT